MFIKAPLLPKVVPVACKPLQRNERVAVINSVAIQHLRYLRAG